MLCSSIHLSALAAASNCRLLHNPWRSTKLCADDLPSGDDTGDTRSRWMPDVSTFAPPVRGARWQPPAVSMQICRLCLQAGEQIARSLHRQPLVIEAQAVEPTELLAGAGTAGSAVIALGHDDAMTGMRAGDRRIDRQDPPVARRDLADDAAEQV